MTKLATVGSKNAAELRVVNAVVSQQPEKRTKFQMVAAGVCPHDGASLLEPVQTKGVGFKAVCSQCGHTWYLNKKIKTCGCLTCRGAKRNATEYVIIHRKENQSDKSYKKAGGPLWTRTRDPSLIRIDESLTISSHDINLNNSLDAWYNEQLLKGITKSTADAHLGRIKALLNSYPTPDIFSIQGYLSEKQKTGYMSGTIANYIKSFRSFFGYLYNNGLYNLEYQRLKIPKIKYRERRVPIDEEVGKLFQELDNDEDRVTLLLLVDCGLRVTELATIKLKNINLKDASILINGKGGKTRTVYLSDKSVKYLGEYISKLNGEYLFPANRSDASQQHRSRRFFEDRLSKLCEKAGVERITPHQLRHYFATHTLSNGADVKAVSEMLGHADVGITLKIYHHVNASAIREMHREYSPVDNVRFVLPRVIRS
jgi:site-specific recombinase XerD